MARYFTTPIYYVNANPHIGHIYTTLMTDIIARAIRLHTGQEVYFVTGTDEHADKVKSAADASGVPVKEWCDTHAQGFQDAFSFFGIKNDDFIRTTEDRHKETVLANIGYLIGKGDVYEGEFEGWYDEGQEEYVTEHAAKKTDYKSSITGRPLQRRKEKNWFFKLNKYREAILEHIRSTGNFITPNQRANEIIARLEGEINDIPITRKVPGGGWGISLPNDPEQVVYVWIDALFNYRSALNTGDDELIKKLWPPTHIIAKDILWFHAVVWPALLIALERPLPERIHAHSFWVHDQRKMGKSSNNFVSIEGLRKLAKQVGADGIRYYLASQGPWDASDASFNEEDVFSLYNTDLARGFGNLVNRVGKLIETYRNNKLVRPGDDFPDYMETVTDGFDAIKQLIKSGKDAQDLNISKLVRRANKVIDGANKMLSEMEPWKLAKQDNPESQEKFDWCMVCAVQMIQIAAAMLHPICPEGTARLQREWNLNSFESLGSCSPILTGHEISGPLTLYPVAEAELAVV